MSCSPEATRSSTSRARLRNTREAHSPPSLPANFRSATNLEAPENRSARTRRARINGSLTQQRESSIASGRQPRASVLRLAVRGCEPFPASGWRELGVPGCCRRGRTLGVSVRLLRLMCGRGGPWLGSLDLGGPTAPSSGGRRCSRRVRRRVAGGLLCTPRQLNPTESGARRPAATPRASFRDRPTCWGDVHRAIETHADRRTPAIHAGTDAQDYPSPGRSAHRIRPPPNLRSLRFAEATIRAQVFRISSRAEGDPFVSPGDLSTCWLEL